MYQLEKFFEKNNKDIMRGGFKKIDSLQEEIDLSTVEHDLRRVHGPGRYRLVDTTAHGRPVVSEISLSIMPVRPFAGAKVENKEIKEVKGMDLSNMAGLVGAIRPLVAEVVSQEVRKAINEIVIPRLDSIDEILSELEVEESAEVATKEDLMTEMSKFMGSIGALKGMQEGNNVG